MSTTKPTINLKSSITRLRTSFDKLRRYSFVAFLLFVAILYGFVMLRINSLRNVEPSESTVSNQVKAAQVPHINEDVVKQLKSLQDNSVSVKALFEETRSNPFQ